MRDVLANALQKLEVSSGALGAAAGCRFAAVTQAHTRVQDERCANALWKLGVPSGTLGTAAGCRFAAVTEAHACSR